MQTSNRTLGVLPQDFHAAWLDRKLTLFFAMPQEGAEMSCAQGSSA